MTPEQAVQTIKDILILIEKTDGKNNWHYPDIEPTLNKVIEAETVLRDLVLEAKNELEYYLHNYG